MSQVPYSDLQPHPTDGLWTGVAIGVLLAVPCWVGMIWVFFG